MMYDFNHIRVEELMEKLSKLPPGTRVSGKFADEATRRAASGNLVREMISKLQSTSTNFDPLTALLRSREDDRQSEH